MSKTIVMHSRAKVPDRLIHVNNGDSILTLRVHKKQVIHAVHKLALSLFMTAMVLLLIFTFKAESPLFWPLAKAAGILGLVFFVANKSNSSLIKSIRK